MAFLARLRREDPRADVGGIGVVIITGSCCIPGMRPFDEEAHRVVRQAIAESGVTAQVKELPASSAMFGAAPKTVVAELVRMLNQGGRIGLPAVLVNGTVVSYGVPAVEAVTAALMEAAGRVAPTTGTPESPVEPGVETEHVHG